MTTLYVVKVVKAIIFLIPNFSPGIIRDDLHTHYKHTTYNISRDRKPVLPYSPPGLSRQILPRRPGNLLYSQKQYDKFFLLYVQCDK